MKPRIFIGSSTESLEVAYSIQENIERFAEVTVWTQGIFEPSKYVLESLVDQLEMSDFGIFVLAPDDVSIVCGQEKKSVRDNIIFELGLFIGKLGKDRNILILPRGTEESLHFPTDLLGLIPVLYDPDRQDGNLRAALGPACNKIYNVCSKFGRVKPADDLATNEMIIFDYSEGDIRAILQSWMGSRPAMENSKLIRFADVDAELKFKPGTTKRYIKEIASKWRYQVEQEGEHTILFKEQPFIHDPSPRGSWMSI
jgi:hypothetical protein